MPIPRCATLIFVLFLSSCESPHEKISRLQSELLKALGERDYFEISVDKEKILLPLPPAPELAEARKIKISEINLETYSFEHETLGEEDKKRLSQLAFQLNEIVKRGNGAFFDPTKCVPADILGEKEAPGDKALREGLLKKMPEYYAEVERRWQNPDPVRARAAAEQSLLVLDWLESKGENTTKARLAVKDFIGLCHSAVLVK